MSEPIDPLLLLWEMPAPPSTLRAALTVQLGGGDYAGALRSLLPPGGAWLCEPGSVQWLLLQALAVELGRIDARAASLVAEADPAAADELLGDWERVFGLPETCAALCGSTSSADVLQRRGALLGKMAVAPSQAPAAYLVLAARITGVAVTLDEFRAEADATRDGLIYSGDGWRYLWRLNVPRPVTPRLFRAGLARAGDGVREWGDCGLECQLRRYAPAHTKLLIAYPTEIWLASTPP